MINPKNKTEIKERIKYLKEEEKKEQNPYRESNLNKLMVML